METGDYAIIITAMVVITLIIVTGINVLSDDKMGSGQCKSQCTLKGLDFESYTGGGYSNYVCNCNNQTTKEIITIYSK